jgi:hypothetical protein
MRNQGQAERANGRMREMRDKGKPIRGYQAISIFTALSAIMWRNAGTALAFS